MLKERCDEIILYRNEGYGPTAISEYLGISKSTVSVVVSDYALKNMHSFPQIHKRRIAGWKFEIGDHVTFDFQEKKYRDLTGVISKVNSSSFLINIDKECYNRVKNEAWFLEGYKNVCISKAKCWKFGREKLIESEYE